MSRTKYESYFLEGETIRALKATEELRETQYFDHETNQLTLSPKTVSIRSLMDAAYKKIEEDKAFCEQKELIHKIANELEQWKQNLEMIQKQFDL